MEPTQEKVDELVEEQKVKTAEVKELHATTDKELWERDLNTFEDALDVFDEEDAKLAEELRKQQNAAKRNQTKAGKKALAKKKKAARQWDSDASDEEDEDFSDDEFVPAPKKRRAQGQGQARHRQARACARARALRRARARARARGRGGQRRGRIRPKLSLAERLLQRSAPPRRRRLRRSRA